jgi:hypothetical protein
MTHWFEDAAYANVAARAYEKHNNKSDLRLWPLCESKGAAHHTNNVQHECKKNNSDLPGMYKQNCQLGVKIFLSNQKV